MNLGSSLGQLLGMSNVVASSMFFQLTIAGDDLGTFNTCSGLGAQVEMEEYAEGGNNGFVHQLPTRIRWSNITLTRPVTEDTLKVMRWVSETVHQVNRKNGQIVALRPNRTKITSWQIYDILPVRWEGPDFDPDGKNASVEKLEIAHRGLEAV